MPHAASLATACVLNGRLYVIGGYLSNKLQVLEMTEENGLSWSCKADLPDERCHAASVVHEGKIWVMGGLVNSQPSASVSIYDPEADVWEAAPPLPRPCIGCRAVTTMEERILLFGSHSFKYENAAWSTAETPMAIFAVWGSIQLG